MGYFTKAVERNACMVWDDINANTFISSPELYNMFKFGSSKDTDRITVSSKEVGENIEFRCFCPKVFSSVSPLHLDDRLKELRRRLIVIPCQRVEELSEERKAELKITDSDWQSKLIDITAYDWKGFSSQIDEFWDIPMAQAFWTTRKIVSKSTKGLTSTQRAMSLDLIATGVSSGLWADEDVAVERLKTYWKWFKDETEKNAGLSGLLKDYIRLETRSASNAGMSLELNTAQLRTQVNNWVAMGWLYEAPKAKDVKELMYDLGMRLQKGKWVKG